MSNEQSVIIAHLLRVEDVAHRLSLSRARIYQLIAEGVLPSVRVGRSVRVPEHLLRRWIEENTTVSG